MDSEFKRLKDEEYDYFQKQRKKNDVFEFDYHLLDVKPKASASNPKPVTSQSTVQKDKAQLQAEIKANIKKEVNSQFTGMDDEKQTGSPSPRKANLLDLTVRSFDLGYNTMAQGKEYYKAMFGKENRVDEYNEKLSSDKYNFEAQGWLGKVISGVSGLLGQTAYQLTTPETAGMTAGMAGLAAVAGQAGPQALVPEEVVTVPWAAGKGFQIGSAVSNFQIATGQAYHELLEHDVSQETAQKIALVVGGVSGLIENSQMDDLLGSFRFMDETNADDGARKLLLNWCKEYLPSTVSNSVEEVLQDAVTISGVNAGGWLENGELAITPAEAFLQMEGTFWDSLATFGAINAIKSAAAVHSASRNTNADPVSTQQTDSTTYAQDDFSTNAIEEDSRSWAQFASDPMYGFDINTIEDDAAQRAQFDWDETTAGIYQSQPNWGMRDAYDMNAIEDDAAQRAQFDWDETTTGIYQSQPNWGMRDAYDMNAIMDDATQRTQFDWDETTAGAYQSQPNLWAQNTEPFDAEAFGKDFADNWLAENDDIAGDIELEDILNAEAFINGFIQGTYSKPNESTFGTYQSQSNLWTQHTDPFDATVFGKDFADNWLAENADIAGDIEVEDILNASAYVDGLIQGGYFRTNGTTFGTYPNWGMQSAYTFDVNAFPNDFIKQSQHTSVDRHLESDFSYLGRWNPLYTKDSFSSGWLENEKIFPYNEGKEIQTYGKDGIYEQAGTPVEGDSGGYAEAQRTDGNGSRLQERGRGVHEIPRESIRLADPAQRQRKLAEEAAEYGVPVEFISLEKWPVENSNHPAYSNGGKIFVREDIPSESFQEIIPHEITHVMRQKKFLPYLELLTETADLLDRSQKDTESIMAFAAEHRGLDIFSMDMSESIILYDEINAFMGGIIGSGRDTLISEQLNRIFVDYQGYRSRVLRIFEQFREQGKQND